MPVHMYVSLQNDNLIRRFELNSADGRLTHVADVEVPDGPAPLGINPAGTVLYVGHRGSASAVTTGGDGVARPQFALSSWVIDQRTGDLARTGGVQVLGEPCFVATDRRGRFVLSSYYQAGHCAVHPLDDAGALGGEAIEWLDTNSGAHSFQTDRSNRFGFVPHIADGSGGLMRLAEGRRVGANAIFQFRFDQETGKLTPNDPPRITPDEQIGPRHHCFHPTRDLVYVNNEQGSVVTVYALDTERGTLAAVQTLGTLPEGATGPNAPSQIHIDRSGRFLYCANRGHDSIACYAIDEATGRLTSTGWTEVGERPRAFNVDPTGHFLYATSQATGSMAAFSIDQQAGTLAPLGTYELGNVPMWVLFAELPGQ